MRYAYPNQLEVFSPCQVFSQTLPASVSDPPIARTTGEARDVMLHHVQIAWLCDSCII